MHRYNIISNSQECVTINYYSDLNEKGMDELLSLNFQRDKSLQYTSVGIHKDDLNFQIVRVPIKNLEVKDNKKHFSLH